MEKEFLEKLQITYTDADIPVLEYYKPYFDSCFIVFHPFYRKVFADSYEYLNNYKLAYPLIERISWAEILKRTEIKNNKKLALAITYSACNDHYRKIIENEYQILEEFYNSIDIEPTYWVEDKIPEDIIVEFANFLIKLDYKEIQIGNWQNFPDINFELVNIEKDGIFNYLEQSQNVVLYTLDKKYCLKLPYNDLPFSFLLTKDVDKELIKEYLTFEGFFADNKTKKYWHLDE